MNDLRCPAAFEGHSVGEEAEGIVELFETQDREPPWIFANPRQAQVAIQAISLDIVCLCQAHCELPVPR